MVLPQPVQHLDCVEAIGQSCCMTTNGSRAVYSVLGEGQQVLLLVMPRQDSKAPSSCTGSLATRDRVWVRHLGCQDGGASGNLHSQQVQHTEASCSLVLSPLSHTSSQSSCRGLLVLPANVHLKLSTLCFGSC